MRGTHILATFYGCAKARLLVDKNLFGKEVERLIDKSEFSIVGKCLYKFKDAGITAVFLISESHVSVHTWPESGNSLDLDIFACDVSRNNEKTAKILFEDMKKLFSPKKIKLKIVKR